MWFWRQDTASISDGERREERDELVSYRLLLSGYKYRRETTGEEEQLSLMSK